MLNENGVFFYGVYGGKDEEKVFTDSSKMDMPRLFSFKSDEKLKELVKDLFEIIEFENVDIGSGKPDFYFQGLFLKKK